MVRSGKSISRSPRKLSSADTVSLISQPIEHLGGAAGDSLAGGPARAGAQTANTRATEGNHCFMRGLPWGKMGGRTTGGTVIPAVGVPVKPMSSQPGHDLLHQPPQAVAHRLVGQPRPADLH